MTSLNLFTIGFTKKSAEYFFRKLSDSGVKKLIDTRLNNVSQLSGFAKRDDLKFFLKEICDIEYIQVPEFAPTHDMLDEYKKVTHDWKKYEKKFIKLITRRRIEQYFSSIELEGACLLCSEDKPHHCHRRLVAEYLQSKYKEIEIRHLV